MGRGNLYKNCTTERGKVQEKREKIYKKFKKEVLVEQEEEIKPHRGRQPQFTTMHVIEG